MQSFHFIKVYSSWNILSKDDSSVTPESDSEALLGAFKGAISSGDLGSILLPTATELCTAFLFTFEAMLVKLVSPCLMGLFLANCE